MKKVYFKAIDSYLKTEEINQATKMLLDYLVEGESIILEKYIPLKVHFGEKGNKTYIESKNFEGILEYFKEREIVPGDKPNTVSSLNLLSPAVTSGPA